MSAPPFVGSSSLRSSIRRRKSREWLRRTSASIAKNLRDATRMKIYVLKISLNARESRCSGNTQKWECRRYIVVLRWENILLVGFIGSVCRVCILRGSFLAVLFFSSSMDIFEILVLSLLLRYRQLILILLYVNIRWNWELALIARIIMQKKNWFVIFLYAVWYVCVCVCHRRAYANTVQFNSLFHNHLIIIRNYRQQIHISHLLSLCHWYRFKTFNLYILCCV